MPNDEQRRRWNDEQMVSSWPKRERFTNAVVPYVVAALDPRPGERVLEIGSGGGNLSVAIAQRVRPGGTVLGADISAGMVALAQSRAKAAKVTNASFAVVDVQSDAIPGRKYDAATSQFGVMFFEDPVAAFSNVRAALKPGGRLAFACWQAGAKNDWCTFPVLAKFAPAPSGSRESPRPAPGPFAFGDARYVRRILTSAGFTEIARRARRLVANVPMDSVADEGMISGMGIAPERLDEARAALERHLDRFRTADGGGRFELHFQVFTARAP